MSATAIAPQELGQITGTSNKEYDLIWFAQACMNNAARLETYIADAKDSGDDELCSLFERAQSASRKGAEEAKQLLSDRLSI